MAGAFPPGARQHRRAGAISGLREKARTFFRLSPAELQARLGCFAVRRGQATKRADVNYNLLTAETENRLGRPRYDLTTIGSFEVILQYGCSQRATVEPIGYPILRMNNLQAYGWDLTDLKYVDLDDAEFTRWRLERGDIVFNRTNSKELVGKCEVFDEEGDWVFASYLMRLRVDRKRALPEFVSAFLNTRAGRVQIDRESRQIIGMSNINAEEIRTLRVPLPETARQAYLVAALDGARAARRQKLHEADELFTGLDGFILDALGLGLPAPHDLSQAFAVRRGDISTRADVHYNQPHFRRLATMIRDRHGAHLRELASVIFSGTTPLSGGDAYTSKELGVPFVRSGEITSDGRIATEQGLYLRRDIHAGPMKRSQLRCGDVLIAIVGATIGSVGVYDRNEEANINQAIAGVRLVPKTVHPDYLVAFLKSSAGQAVLEMVSRPVARANINLDEVGELFIPVPDPKVQKTIVDEVARRREAARGLRGEAAELWDDAKRRFEEELLGPDRNEQEPKTNQTRRRGRR